MKILKFLAENFKKLSVVEITPDGNVVVISGKNGAGKSSVLDGIEASLRGGRCLPKQPIKTGEHRAKVETEIGDHYPEYKVTRKFFGTNSTLKVEFLGEPKSEIRSPQAFLDKIVGDISFDPLAFLNKQPAEQRNTLMEFLGLNLEEFAVKIAGIKIERSDVRKEKERKLHEADSLVLTPLLPDKEQKVDSLLAELKEIQHYNDGRHKIASDNAVTVSRLEATKRDMVAGEKAILDWEHRLGVLLDQKLELEKQLVTLPPIKNSAEAERKLHSLEATNEAIRRNAQKREAAASADRCITEYARLGDEIKVVENEKAKKLAETVMPVKGLTILPDGLAYNGLPLEDECDSKKLEICVAISMAMNPKLKVLRISGNDLDTESLLAIGKIVDNQGYQVWIEKVSDDNKIGFFIEDGHLVNGEALKTFSEKVVPLVSEGLPGAIQEALE